jgi:hypothetical protein
VHSGRTSQGDAQRDETLGESQRAPGPGGRHRGQAFREDTPTAAGIAAKPFADAELEAHAILRPGQVGEGAFVMAVDALRRCGAERTGHAGLRRAHPQGDLRRGVIDMTRREAQPSGIG